jgi:hypothetical protein
MGRTMAKRLELYFWKKTVNTLDQSRLARTMVRSGMHLAKNGELGTLIITLSGMAMAGFLGGFILTLFINLVSVH